MKNSTVHKLSFIGIQLFLVFTIPFYGQQVKDIDGNVYDTILFNGQTWIAGNLNVSHFRNGEAIPQAVTEEEWKVASDMGRPVWCFYENNAENGRKYGKLYNWYAINDPRGLAPEGWHIAANNDWRTLIKNLFGVDIAGTSLRSTSGWKLKPGTNKIGFSAIPAGYRESGGIFRGLEESCRWWSNSVPVEVKPSNTIYSVVLNDMTYSVQFLKSDKGSGFSVRCEKD